MLQFKAEGVSLAEFPHWFPERQIENYYGGKGPVETTELSIPRK